MYQYIEYFSQIPMSLTLWNKTYHLRKPRVALYWRCTDTAMGYNLTGVFITNMAKG